MASINVDLDMVTISEIHSKKYKSPARIVSPAKIYNDKALTTENSYSSPDVRSSRVKF